MILRGSSPDPECQRCKGTGWVTHPYHGTDDFCDCFAMRTVIPVVPACPHDRLDTTSLYDSGWCCMICGMEMPNPNTMDINRTPTDEMPSDEARYIETLQPDFIGSVHTEVVPAFDFGQKIQDYTDLLATAEFHYRTRRIEIGEQVILQAKRLHREIIAEAFGLNHVQTIAVLDELVAAATGLP